MDNFVGLSVIIALLILSLLGLIKADTFKGILLSVLLIVFTAYITVYVY